MSGIVRNALRVVGVKNLVSSTSTARVITPQLSRCMWHMSNRSQSENSASSASKLLRPFETCGCGCGRAQHTKGYYYWQLSFNIFEGKRGFGKRPRARLPSFFLILYCFFNKFFCFCFFCKVL